MGRCVIVGGAEIQDYDRLRTALHDTDYYIFCDSGLKHLEPLGVLPDLIVGDFDSHPVPHLPVETIRLPREKDDTDTMFAAREAQRRGFSEVLLLGAIGRRLDHSLGNVAILYWLAAQGMVGTIWDDYSELELVGQTGASVSDSYPYFSLLNLGGTAKGVTIRHAKYPLEDAEIPWDYPYGVSNEPLPGETAEITVREGKLLLVKVIRP